MKGSWERIKEIIQERGKKKWKVLDAGKESNQSKSWVSERILEEEQRPMPLDPHPRFWTGWPQEQEAAQLSGQELCSTTRQLGSNPGSTTCLASSYLGFLSCETGIKTNPISHGVGPRIIWDNPRKAFSTMFGTHNTWELLIPFFQWEVNPNLWENEQ